jgi:hypothetical protein
MIEDLTRVAVLVGPMAMAPERPSMSHRRSCRLVLPPERPRLRPSARRQAGTYGPVGVIFALVECVDGHRR